MAVNPAQTYAEMTDEQIAIIKRRIETFHKSREFFNKFCHAVAFDRGSKTMKVRRTVRPRVKAEDVKPATELVAPRPIKAAVETFVRSIDIYDDKFVYSREDVLFGYDDIVKIGADTLAEIFTQKLDYIKGTPFIKSACTASYDTSRLKTLAKVAIILKKNGALPWANGRFLAIVTPETLEGIRVELEAKGSSISEPTKEDIDSGIIGHYGRWDFAECPSDLLQKNASTHYMVLMGRRPNGDSPVDVAKMKEVEVYNNGLGSGVVLDEDGNYTSDDNKQKGSIAMTAPGLGAYVNDDLCIIDVEVSETTIGESDINQAEKTGYASISPASTLVISAVAAADGSAIASPTIVVKKKSSSGTEVTASGGKYPVTPGDLYYYSVAKTNYTTVTGTFRANAGANSLVIALAAS